MGNSLLAMKIHAAAKGHQIKQTGGRPKTRQMLHSGTLKSVVGYGGRKKNFQMFFRTGSLLKKFTWDVSPKNRVFTDRIPCLVRWEHRAPQTTTRTANSSII